MRSVIAGVLVNGLKKGMPLQVDANVSIVYEHKPVVTYRHLEVDPPYNTYRYPGLPLAIASPVRLRGRGFTASAAFVLLLCARVMPSLFLQDT